MRIGLHLAVFGGNRGDDLVGMLFQQFLELEHDPCAAQRRRGRPGREGCLGGGDGSIQLSLGG